jgi:hypothetical protein
VRRLFAVDADSGVLRWATHESESHFGCASIVVVESLRVAITSSAGANQLRVYSLYDGAPIASLRASEPSALAVDETTAAIPVIYASTAQSRVLGGTVSAIACDPFLAPVPGSGINLKRGAARHAIAVIPGAPPTLAIAAIGSSIVQVRCRVT